MMYTLLVLFAASAASTVPTSSDSCKPDQAGDLSSRSAALLQVTFPAAQSAGTDLQAGHVEEVMLAGQVGLEPGRDAGAQAGVEAYEMSEFETVAVEDDGKPKTKKMS